MAKSIRYWLKTMNLTEDKPKEGTKLTELGRIILTGDPYLEDIFYDMAFTLSDRKKLCTGNCVGTVF